MFFGCDSSSTSPQDGPVALDTNSYGIPWNSKVQYGALKDSRDGKVYRTLQIGSQTWMAQNLSWAAVGSVCPEDSLGGCPKYGRLYSWTTAMELPDSFLTRKWSGSLPRKGICPEGWHVPSTAEWITLWDAVGGTTAAMTIMRSNLGWTDAFDRPLAGGSDSVGFRVIPAGQGFIREAMGTGQTASFWSATESDSVDAFYWEFYYLINRVTQRTYYGKDDANSLRCVKN